MLDDGIEAAVICYGLHEAAKAPSPSWRYAAAVIARCVREGIRTAADIYPQARPGRNPQHVPQDGHRPARYANRCTPNGNTRRRTSFPPGCRSVFVRCIPSDEHPRLPPLACPFSAEEERSRAAKPCTLPLTAPLERTPLRQGEEAALQPEGALPHNTIVAAERTLLQPRPSTGGRGGGRRGGVP